MGRVTFFRHFLKDPRRVGSIVPSSRALAKAMTQGIDFEHHFVVELGCGTGAVTEEIANSLRHPDRYLGFEIEPGLHENLGQRFGKLRFVADSAAELERYLDPKNQPIHAVVSSLPFTSIERTVTRSVIEKYSQALAPGGIFRLFLYAHTYRLPRNQELIEQLSELLSPPTVELVLWNMPPARVLTFTKKPLNQSPTHVSKR